MDVTEVRNLLIEPAWDDAAWTASLQHAVESALAQASGADAAHVVAELGRAAAQGRRDERVSAVLQPLMERARHMLDDEVTARSRVRDTERQRTLADQILRQVRARPSSPTDLAIQLDVHISQISRAAKELREQGRLEVRQDDSDRRKHVYLPAERKPAVKKLRDLVAKVIPSVPVEAVQSDLVPDRLGDRFSQHAFEGVLRAVAQDVSDGLYEPSLMHRVRIGKEGGGTRPGAAPAFADRVVYAALVERCRDQIELALGDDSAVLWPGGRRKPAQWVQLEQFVDNAADPYVLCVDVQSFYETIRHDILRDRLLAAGCDADTSFALEDLLGRVVGKDEGLPQGLEPSDPLAGLMLAPLDRALHRERVRFVRHGDDLRCVARSIDEAEATIRLVRDELEALELLVNDGKTRTLRRDKYMQRRGSVRRALSNYLESQGSPNEHTVVHELLTALGADEELQWDWYHGRLTVQDVLGLGGGATSLEDKQAILALLDAVLDSQAPRWDVTPAKPGNDGVALFRTSLDLMATHRIRANRLLPVSELTKPAYDDVLPRYISAVAPIDPDGIRALLGEISSFPDQDGLWLRIYREIDGVQTDGFIDIASKQAAGWPDAAVRVRAARFIRSRRDDLLNARELLDETPPSLRDDALAAVPPKARPAATQLPQTTQALLAAA